MISGRHNPLRERGLSLTWVIAGASGILAAVAGAAPTGARAVDFVLVALAVTAVTGVAATAPWWALTGVCGVAALSASRPLLVVIALGAVALTIFIGARRRSAPIGRAVAAFAAIQVFARLDSR
ncbi:MAG: hypothetical protein QOD72_1236, partial [Acidimicrobiaceae bacterium]|nr:hypothetical protein [Acidimicrobiaceae bacterium]